MTRYGMERLTHFGSFLILAVWLLLSWALLGLVLYWAFS